MEIWHAGLRLHDSNWTVGYSRGHYVLRALEYFRSTEAELDDRLSEAVNLVAAKRDEKGRWRLENTHQGPTHFEMDRPDGFPSRWNTLRARRVMDWSGFDT